MRTTTKKGNGNTGGRSVAMVVTPRAAGPDENRAGEHFGRYLASSKRVGEHVGYVGERWGTVSETQVCTLLRLSVLSVARHNGCRGVGTVVVMVVGPTAREAVKLKWE
jgi:hypothetical protein